jgi:hypothetical protein
LSEEALPNIHVDVSGCGIGETDTLSPAVDAAVAILPVFPSILVIRPKTTLQLDVPSDSASCVAKLYSGAKTVYGSLVLRSDLTVDHANGEAVS